MTYKDNKKNPAPIAPTSADSSNASGLNFTVPSAKPEKGTLVKKSGNANLLVQRSHQLAELVMEFVSSSKRPLHQKLEQLKETDVFLKPL
jgi:hypothetical protein